jgi:hypothetical protein
MANVSMGGGRHLLDLLLSKLMSVLTLQQVPKEWGVQRGEAPLPGV